jgi:anti-sigma regulatory factor (Ser/Thr protein kinase)
VSRRSLSTYTWRLAPSGLRSAIATNVLSPFGVDLSNIHFVTPGGIVGLACILEAWTAKHGAVPVVLPCEDVTAYMQRMDFFGYFEDRLCLDRDIGYLQDRRRHTASLSELRTVRDAPGVTRVTEQFCATLSNRGVPKGKVRRCFTVISETLNNAVDHASSPCGAYTAIQTWPNLNKVAVAVSDAGVGIPHTIGVHSDAYGAGLTDHELIRLAAYDQVSSHQNEEGRGGGLTCALRNVRSGGGKMVIWSGRGWVEFKGEDVVTVAELAPAFAGTCAEAVFPIS